MALVALGILRYQEVCMKDIEKMRLYRVHLHGDGLSSIVDHEGSEKKEERRLVGSNDYLAARGPARESRTGTRLCS